MNFNLRSIRVPEALLRLGLVNVNVGNLVDASGYIVAMTDQLKAFEKRASAAFAVASLPSLAGIKPVYARDVRWQYLDQRFWGTVSKYEVFDAK